MIMKKSLIAANWKMHKTIAEAVSFMEMLQREVGAFDDREVVVAPPFVALAAVRHAIWRDEGFKLSAQNCHWEDKGAFTGEISAAMARDAGCDYVIIGHSERRHIFGETDDMVAKKVISVFRQGMLPILCMGELLQEREGGKTFQVVGRQLEQGLKGVDPRQAEVIALAYEPVWAIGTGKTATPELAQEVHAFIRERCSSLWDKTVASKIRILYGGSVKPDNVDELMAKPDIDGMLVGGASLEVASFRRIVEYQSAGAGT
jgi:triosephosphate isomerase (TIM)